MVVIVRTKASAAGQAFLAANTATDMGQYLCIANMGGSIAENVATFIGSVVWLRAHLADNPATYVATMAQHERIAVRASVIDMEARRLGFLVGP